MGLFPVRAPLTMSCCPVAHCVSSPAALIRRSPRFMSAAVLVAALCLTSVAQGATITVHPEDNNGRIFVDIAGKITSADIKTFFDKVEHLPSEKVYVSLSSDGGDAVGVVIGDHIRLSGMKTLVPENKRCASVCAIIWLGAHDRYVGGENTALGFHGPYSRDTGQPGSINVRYAVYLGFLGFSYDAVDWILGAPPLALRWLSPETSKQYGIYYLELRPKRSVPFVDEQVENITPAPTAPTQTPAPPQAPPVPPQLPQQSPQTTQGQKRPFRVVDVSDGFLQLRKGPGPRYEEVARIPEGAPIMVGRCVPAWGRMETVLRSGMAGSKRLGITCCMAELEETTQFSYRVTQNLILRSGPDKSSWNMLTNYAPNDYIPEGKIFTWKRRPDAGNCTSGRGGEIWCQLTYPHDGGIKTDGWVSAHFLRSTTTQRLLACLFQNRDPDCADDGAAPFR